MRGPVSTFSLHPLGSFDLAHQNGYFNPWPEIRSDPGRIAMAFPVEGWSGSAVVTLVQRGDGTLDGGIYGDGESERARAQALASLSLDEDGAGWPAVGQRDRRLGEIQEHFRALRPALFHSPYEAAAAFVIGHRISIDQTRRLRAAIAAEHGAAILVADQTFHAFPGPHEILALDAVSGLSSLKVERLHGVARAALEGILDRPHLRSLPEAEALVELQSIPGIGPFFATGILYRGAGLADGLLRDDTSRQILRTVYELAENPSDDDLERITGAWRPYRSWAMVLLHAWIRETGRMPSRREPGRPG